MRETCRDSPIMVYHTICCEHIMFKLYSTVESTTIWWRARTGETTEYREAMAAFWRTFSHEGKISLGWCGWGVHAHPLSLHLPSPVKLSLRSSWVGRYTNPVSSLVKICTLCNKQLQPYFYKIFTFKMKHAIKLFVYIHTPCFTSFFILTLKSQE